MLEFWIGYASMAMGAIIIALYIAYLRYRFERHLAFHAADEFWNPEEVDLKSKIRYLLAPSALYAISIGAVGYFYFQLSRLAVFWVHFDLDGNPDIPMTVSLFIAFNVIFGAIVFSPILISFPGKETLRFISKAYIFVFLTWLLIESDIIIYNLTKRHLITYLYLILISVAILSLPLLYITFRDLRPSQS